MRRSLSVLGVCGLTLMAAGPLYTAGLTPGQYDLSAAGGKAAGSVCVGDLRPLLQSAHGSDNCRFFTVQQEARSARVSYECAGGSGLVELKTITPRSAVLRATGVRGRAPYKTTVNARRSGDCR